MDLSTYGLPVLLLAQVTGVHLDTARRWKRAGKVPAHYAPLIALRIEGDLGLITDQWKGFRLAQGDLWTPEGTPVSPGEVRAIPYRRDQIRELERRLSTPQQWQLI